MESYEKIKKVLALGFMNFLDENKPKDKMCLSNGECADIEKAFNEQDWPKLERYLDKYTESEDEKIRIELLKDIPNVFPYEKAFRYIHWLEKQKERGPLTKEEEYTLQRIIEYLEDETCPPEWISLLHDIYCLPYEKQKEQKPTKCSEYEIEEMVAKRSRSTGTTKSEMDFYRNGIKDAIKRFGLRPSWKPTPEQLDTLHTAAYLPEMEFYGGLKDKLRELYKNLKRL